MQNAEKVFSAQIMFLRQTLTNKLSLLFLLVRMNRFEGSIDRFKRRSINQHKASLTGRRGEMFLVSA